MKQELVKYVEKPWGYEKWLAVTDHYALKEIFFKKGERCSFQYHNQKEEHIYILKGKLESWKMMNIKNCIPIYMGPVISSAILRPFDIEIPL
ncbi:hypothetical protein [uncultured Faecalicoccus sp.]|uniref:hypothetical protein n=1 Tax=uncultured Faecalicoccus sp. TaxID=1971760 RepID=UPI0025851623|nr:hypothetical protein [uncultured Faecalicoccus sp.]